MINNSQISINNKYGLSIISDDLDEHEFTLAKKIPPNIPKRTKNVSVDLSANRYKKDRIKIKKPVDSFLEEINNSMVKKNRPSSAFSTPMRNEKKRTADEVKQTVDAMLERFKNQQDQFKKKVENMKMMIEEYEMSFFIDKQKNNKNVKVSNEDFLKRQEMYKDQVEKKINELKELQTQKLIEMEKANPGYGLKIEEDEIQQKIDWLIKWKDQIIKRNLERKKELMKKLMEECTFQPNISQNSKKIMELNLKKWAKIPPFERLSRVSGSTAPKKRNLSVRAGDSKLRNKSTLNEKEEIKNLKKGLKKTNTKTNLTPIKKGLPPSSARKPPGNNNKIKSNAPTIPSNSSSKRSIVSQSQDKKIHDKNAHKDGIFDEKFIVNNITMSLVQGANSLNDSNKSRGHPAGEISLKNKNFKVLPKLSEKELEIMQDLLIQKMNGGDDK
jgi:hypothetical protein